MLNQSRTYFQLQRPRAITSPAVSRMMSIELNVNFRFPFRHFAAGVLAAWHQPMTWLAITSSRLANQYGAWKTHRNLRSRWRSESWHGAAWTFVIWGVYQGAMLVVGRTIALGRSRRGIVSREANLQIPARCADVSGACCGWLIFERSRCSSWDDSRVLFTDFRPTAATIDSLLIPLLQLVLPLMVVTSTGETRR